MLKKSSSLASWITAQSTHALTRLRTLGLSLANAWVEPFVNARKGPFMVYSSVLALLALTACSQQPFQVNESASISVQKPKSTTDCVI